MTIFETQTQEKIVAIKSNPSGTVNAVGMVGPVQFQLISVTHSDEDNMQLIRLLARWRKKHEIWFPAQFPVTIKRTKEWVKTRVLFVPDRLLFMISIHDTYRGHVGLYRFDFDRKTCEIDNIVRGKSGTKGLMEFAIITMMEWGKKQLGLKGYTLQTTSDNARALALYTRLGFVETKRVPLIYTKTVDGGEWTTPAKGYTGSIERYDVYMKQTI